MTEQNKTGYEWYYMIPKQQISPEIKKLQDNFETVSKNKDFKNQEIKNDLEMLNNIKNESNPQKGALDQRHSQSKKDYTVEESNRIRDNILKQSKRKPPVNPKIQDLQNKLQDSNAHSGLEVQQKSGSVKNLAAKFESLSSAKESKTDAHYKAGKLSDNPDRKSFMERLNKEVEQRNDAGRGR